MERIEQPRSCYVLEYAVRESAVQPLIIKTGVAVKIKMNEEHCKAHKSCHVQYLS